MEEQIVQLHPILRRFVKEVKPVVDRFHFKKNHKGKWCHMYVNPYKVKELQDAAKDKTLNMSITEQRFNHINGFKRSFNHMNGVRFRYMLMMVQHLDHQKRAAMTGKRT